MPAQRVRSWNAVLRCDKSLNMTWLKRFASLSGKNKLTRLTTFRKFYEHVLNRRTEVNVSDRRERFWELELSAVYRFSNENHAVLSVPPRTIFAGIGYANFE